jgi:hypothetical protein
MNHGMARTLSLAAILLCFTAPAGAAADTGDPVAPAEPAAESPAILAYDAAWRADAVTAPQIRPNPPAAARSPLALIGSSTLLFVVVALGLTLTFRSLRTDIRRQRGTHRYRDPDVHSRVAEAPRR